MMRKTRPIPFCLNDVPPFDVINPSRENIVAKGDKNISPNGRPAH